MKFAKKAKLDISIVMPCLNERSTVGICIDEAQGYIRRRTLKGEIIIADNGSTDGSADIARSHGAAVIYVPKRGYGRALRAGISQTSGKVIIFADCDTTYDLSDLDKFYFPLASEKCDVMIGNRFAGKIQHGAMPALHYVGVKFLSACGRAAFGSDVRDFHCGIRGITRKSAEKLHLCTVGMEFATEFIAEAAECGLRIQQCPALLRKCEYERRSKLRTFPDGMRHLRFITRRRKKHTPCR